VQERRRGFYCSFIIRTTVRDFRPVNKERRGNLTLTDGQRTKIYLVSPVLKEIVEESRSYKLQATLSSTSLILPEGLKFTRVNDSRVTRSRARAPDVVLRELKCTY